MTQNKTDVGTRCTVSLPKNTKGMKRRKFKCFRRNVGAPKGYQKPIVQDAFVFAGMEISEKKERDYLKAIV